MEELFILAARKKYRYQYKGTLTTEDLWDLPVESLDAIYKNLNAELKKQNSEEESLLSGNKKTGYVTTIENQIKIVKHIVSVKLVEAEKRKKAAAAKKEKERLMEVLARKQDAKIEGMSEEELAAKIAALSEETGE